MDPFTIVLVAVGFGAIAVAGARFGASTTSLAGLFVRQGAPSWPRGVQEDDAPHFALERLASDPPGRADATAGLEDRTGHATPIGAVRSAAPHWRG
jgi:hypothetical protein